ncbi:hypothetical protein BH23GEM9_BH23GEM9_06470 [soil metagenome]
MTQPSRTTESISRDNAAIRDIMHSIRELTVPDRATLAVGLIGHLATMMNRSQLAKLLGELNEEAERVQDVPPSRRQDMEARTAATQEMLDRDADGREMADREPPGAGEDDRLSERRQARGGAGREAAHPGVGQAGRGEFRSGELL